MNNRGREKNKKNETYATCENVEFEQQIENYLLLSSACQFVILVVASLMAIFRMRTALIRLVYNSNVAS